MSVRYSWRTFGVEQTVKIETHRRMPNAISRRPPLNMMTRVIFFAFGRCDFHTIGIGIAIK